MKIWYVSVDHVPVGDRGSCGPAVTWAHGKDGEVVSLEDLTIDWLRANGFKTKAAAIRSSYRMDYGDNDYWAHNAPCVTCMEVPDLNLKYKIYRCYEIVILDSEGNAVKESDYCYTTRADAEELARHEIEILESNG